MREPNNKLDCVLLIDDDEATNFYHTLILEEECEWVHIQSVNSAKEGLDYLLGKGVYANSPQPGIVFLDINMPGMDGWEFLEAYDELSKDIHDRVVVSILTTSFNPGDKDRAETIPSVKEFANKPLTPEVFWSLVDKNF
ncbi:response regulator [Cyclobacterium plantarum]|uniref:response regulator n=1 Tax=Cyclobacterium plantarum TaxID=2716263 RepID=UPI003F6F1642